MAGKLEEEVLKRVDTQGLITLAQQLIHIQTFDPPSDYSGIAARLQETLEGLGMETQVLEGSPGKKMSLACGGAPVQRKRSFF